MSVAVELSRPHSRDGQQERPPNVLAGLRHRLGQFGIAAIVGPMEITKTGIVDVIQVVVGCVRFGTQPKLDIVLREVRFDSGGRRFGVEGAKDQTSACPQTGECFPK